MKTEWSLSEIASRIYATIHGTGEIMVSSLATDSRNLIPSDTILFIALTGENHDGHHFIGELYQSGIRAFMVSRLPDISLYPDAGFCLVEDTLSGLQALASEKRNQFSGTVAAISGSNGKTIVKEWIYHCMGSHFNVHRSPKSYNSQVGVPLSLWMIDNRNDMAIIEAGISQPGEMEKLERIISPGIGLFTNLGSAHQENFSDLEEKLKEKLRLFERCHKVICRSGAGTGDILVETYLDGPEVVRWSLDGGDAEYRYLPVKEDRVGTAYECAIPSGTIRFRLPFSDEASLENAFHAITFSLEAGLPAEVAAERAEAFEPVSMRLEMLRGINNSVLINDAYNSDIKGLSAALDLVKQQDPQKERVLILSDMLQSGLEEGVLFREIAGLISQKGIGRFIGIGPSSMRQSGLFPSSSRFYPDTDSFLKGIDRNSFRDSIILVKGSRRYSFERITGELQLKTHQTLLEIDLNAMVGNLNYFRSLLGDGVKIMVMVKALSYGSGNVEIASLLQYHKVDYLAVAFIDEGIELREAGIQIPIMVLNPDPAGYGTMVDHRLEPEIFGIQGLEKLYRVLHYRGVRNYPVHIKIDTGMHRLGFQQQDLESAIPLLLREEFRVATVFSHLAASDEPEHDDFTQHQIDLFGRLSDSLSAALKWPFEKHLLNSAGIERFPEAQFQMVRLGIGLHGIGRGHQLSPVSAYKTNVSQIRKVSKGDTIGYSRSGVVTRDIRVATIPVGYADGLDRRLGNGVGKVHIKGTLVPTVGNICMDMAMIDVTGIDVSEGDEVEIFGKNLPVSELARLAGTIPYEVLTSIPERVKRIYLQE